MNGIDRRSVLRHGLGALAVLGATAGLVALRAAGTGAPGASEPANTTDPALDGIREHLARPVPGASSTP